ncbi:hypothetical protein [Nocardioides mangrovicus]|nr:hypothetical protein [Nocardioides mangrovicus]
MKVHQPPVRRVRHEVRDGLYVMGFSLAASLALALALAVLPRIGG